MNTIYLDIMKVVIPALITGTITYWVTKYNKRPTDKIAISYNKIYHPLFQLIRNSKELEYIIILEETKKRLNKYDKFASRTTVAAYKLLEENIDNKYRKRYFHLLEDDIYKYNTKFRRMLGYPEPPAILIFKYLTFYNQVQFILSISIIAFVFAAYMFGVFSTYHIVAQIAFIIFVIAGFIAFICGCLLFLHFIILKVQSWISENRKK